MIFGQVVVNKVQIKSAPINVDETYEDIVLAFNCLETHQHLPFALAMLIILCNQIGDRQIISEALDLANKSVKDSNLP